MATPAQALKDDKFWGLPVEERRKVLRTLDPKFAGLPPPEQDKVIRERPKTGDTFTGVGGELLKQGGKFAKGVLEAGVKMTPPGQMYEAIQDIRDPSRIGKQFSGLAEIFKAPVRELAGRQQPGKDAGPPAQGWIDRPLSAVTIFLGGDPSRRRELVAAGKPIQGAIADLAIPILTLGIGSILKSTAGEKLPPPATRVNKLTAATGAASVDIPKIYEDILPRLDETVKQTGKIPVTPRDLVGTVDATLNRLEAEFNTSLQGIAGKQTVPISVADAIRSRITSAMRQTAEGRQLRQTLEKRAVEFEKPWSYQALNEERMRLFRMNRTPAVERAAQRTNADVMADSAAENALRELVYGDLDKATGKSGYFGKLKKDESSLLSLKDQLDKRVIELSNKEAMRAGSPWYEKEAVSTYGHPMSGRAGVAVHKLQEPLVGGAMKSASRKVRQSFAPKGVPLRKSVPAARILTAPDEDQE